MIKRTGKKDRPVAVTAGCTIEWQEPISCIVVRRKNGSPLLWGDGKTKRIMEMIRNVHHFRTFVEINADQMNLKVVWVEGKRNPTFRFK